MSDSSFWDALTQLKYVSEVRLEGERRGRDIRTLIEGHYGFSFEDLDRWGEMCELREVVNSLKHRRGRRSWKRHRKSGWPKNLLGKDDVDIDKAAKAIDDVRGFLLALETAVVNRPVPDVGLES